MKKVNFCDVVNGYIYVLFGFFANLYIIFSSSIYFSLEEEFQQHLGISKETLINYFAIFSILLLLFSLYNKWTWPIKVEEALIVIFMWILLRNILPKDCACCNPPAPTLASMNIQITDGKAPTPSPTNQELTLPTLVLHKEGDATAPPAEPPDCSTIAWTNSHLTYSVLCVLVMFSSFLMNARNNFVSLAFTIMTIALVIFTTLIPISCNQLNRQDINTNLLKFTLYSIVWFLNRRMRLSERVLSLQYLKSIQILYSYDDHHQNHLLCGAKHRNRKRISSHGRQQHQHCQDECDDIAYFIYECSEEAALIPRPLFNKLDILYHNVIGRANPNATSRIYHNRADEVKARNFACQIRNLQKIHGIHHRFNHFFSWKHRLYDSEIQNIFDLSKTLWILNVCPAFLLFIFLEYILLSYHIHWNIKELKCLISRVKVMRYIQGSSSTCYY